MGSPRRVNASSRGYRLRDVRARQGVYPSVCYIDPGSEVAAHAPRVYFAWLRPLFFKASQILTLDARAGSRYCVAGVLAMSRAVLAVARYQLRFGGDRLFRAYAAACLSYSRAKLMSRPMPRRSVLEQ